MRKREVFLGPGTRAGASVGALIVIGNVLLQALPEFRQNEFTLGVSLQFGVALTVVGLQWDIFSIVRSTTEARNRANVLMDALEHSNLQEKELVNLCEAAAALSDDKLLPSFVLKDVEGTIAHHSHELGEMLDHRRLTLDTERRLLFYLHSLAEISTKSILATSAIEGVDSTFWDSEEGQTYLAVQAERRKSHPNITLRRIFLIAREHDLDDTGNKRGLTHIIRRHEEAGFEVGILYETKLDDFVVFDERYVVHSDLAAMGDVAVGGVADFQEDRARMKAREFEKAWIIAKDRRERLRSAETAAAS